MKFAASTPTQQAKDEGFRHRQRLVGDSATCCDPKSQTGTAEKSRAAERLHVSTCEVQLQVQLALGQNGLQRIGLGGSGEPALDAAATPKGTPSEPQTQRRQSGC